MLKPQMLEAQESLQEKQKMQKEANDRKARGLLPFEEGDWF